MIEQPQGSAQNIRDINDRVKAIVENETLGKPVWIGGLVRRHFISDRGHEYFTLYDEDYSISCFVREPVRGTLGFSISNQMEIEVFGTIRVYERQAQVQIDVENAKEISRSPIAMDGTAKEQLERRGLWPPKPKELPQTIRAIGLVTSAHSEANADFVTAYRDSGGKAKIVPRDVRIQGQQAPREIADAINRMNREGEVDVIVLTRGGGRLADLATFDDYLIAQAIAESKIPVVTGIGHDRDDTFADEMADVKTSTPTAAGIHLAREENNSPAPADDSSVTQLLIYSVIGLAFATLIVLIIVAVLAAQ